MSTSARVVVAGRRLVVLAARILRGFAGVGALLAFSVASTQLVAAYGESVVQADSIEADAQEYTRLVMQHDHLLLLLNMGRAEPVLEADLPGLRAQGQAIQDRYSASGELREHGPRFSARVKELSAKVVAPAVLGWITDAFPEVDEVLEAWGDDVGRGAALSVLENTLREKVGQPTPGAAAEKLERYRVARAQLGSRASAEELSWTLPFQVEVLERFAPLYAVESDNALRRKEHEALRSDREAQVFLGYKLVGFLVLLVPWLYLLRGQRPRSRADGHAAGEDDPFQLPPELRTVRLFRKRFEVRFECGLVTDKEHTVEKVERRYSTPGEVTVVSGLVFRSPGTWGSSVREDHYYTYTFETPDGRRIRHRYLSYPSDIEVGQLMSTITFDGDTLIVCNNTQGSTLTLATNSRMSGSPLWILSVGLALAGLWSIQHFFVEPSALADDWRFGYMVSSLTLLAAIVSAFHISILKKHTEKRRERQFHERWGPPLRAFLEGCTPMLQKHFGARLGECTAETS